MSKIKLYLLGDSKLVRVDGMPKILRDSRVHQLLVYLATNTERQSYADLSQKFEPHFTSIRHDLDRQSESLTGLPFEGYIDHEKNGKNTVALTIKSPDIVTTDINDFRGLLSHWVAADTQRWSEAHLPILDKAIKIYRGDLLKGFTSGFPQFSNWLYLERRRLRHLAAWANVQLMYASWSRNQLIHAQSIGESWLQKDPLCHRGTGWQYYLLICIAYWRDEPERAQSLFESYHRKLQEQQGRKLDKDISHWSKIDELIENAQSGRIPHKPTNVLDWQQFQDALRIEVPSMFSGRITNTMQAVDDPDKNDSDEGEPKPEPQSGSLNINDIAQLLRGATQSDVDPERLLRGRVEILKTVRRYWIDHVLNSSLEGVPNLDLQFIETPKYVGGLAALYPDESDNRHAKRSYQEIPQFFEACNRKLLILGDPGRGKTTTLLYLTERLLKGAENDVHNPIPIVFNLSTWTSDYSTLEDWLINELRQTYKLSSEQIATHWVQTDSLVIMLDGLDEVADSYRNDCLNAINQYLATHGLLSEMVVTCRLGDYEALGNKLNLNSAITMQDLDSHQIEGFLEEVAGITSGMMQFIDNNPSVREILESPLVLNLMVRAFDHSNDDVDGQVDPIDEHIYSHYVRRMYERRAGEKDYTFEETVHYLKQLASSMNQNSEHMLHLELLQPSWLTENRQGIYRLVVWFLSTLFAVVFGVVTSVSVGSMPGALPHTRPITTFLMFGCLMWLFFSPKQLWRNPLYSLIPGIVAALGDYLHFALFNEVTQAVYFEMLSSFIRFTLMSFIGVVIFALLRLQTNRIKPSEKLKFSLRYSNWRGGIAGFLSGISIYSLYAVYEVSLTTPGFLIGMLVSGSILGVTVLLLTAFRSVDVDMREQPNQGIRASLKYAFMFSLFGVLFTIGLLAGLAISTSMDYALWRAAGLGLFLVYPLWFIFGGLAVIQHYVLRLMLENERRIPPDIQGFLDHAVSLILMRRVGGGYTFIHKSLQDYFVDL